MSIASAAIEIVPSKLRSKITNDPSQRHGRSAEARRVKDLFYGYSAALGNPSDTPTMALILSAAEAVTIAEKTRADHIAGKIVLNEVIRAEGAANRALKRLGLARPTPPKRKTFAEKMAEIEASQRAAEARTAADGVEGVETAAISDQRTGVAVAEDAQ